MTDERVIAPDFGVEDTVEPSLRPKVLDEFIGQKSLRENLRVFIDAARSRDGRESCRTSPSSAG